MTTTGKWRVTLKVKRAGRRAVRASALLDAPKSPEWDDVPAFAEVLAELAAGEDADDIETSSMTARRMP